MNDSFEGFTHGRATVDGCSMHYQVGGRGDPVVLLHGWPQHSLQWHAVAPVLAESYRVIVPDMPGCGGSGFSARGYDKATVAELVRGLVEQVDQAPVRLVGYDHGAGVAYNYACQQRDGVRQLAIMEYVLPGRGYEKAMMPAPGWHTGSNWQLAFFTVPDAAEFAFRGRERELLTWFLWHGSCNPEAVSEEHLRRYTDQLRKPGALRAGIEYYAAVWRDLEVNNDNLTRQLDIPVLGIGGRHNLGEMAAKALSGVSSDVTGAVIEDAGHWISDENPHGLARVLLDFFGK